MLVHQLLREKSDDGVISVAPGSSVAEAAGVLSNRRIGTVIVSGDGQVALGILSERDIVRELGRSGSVCLTMTVDELMTTKLVSCAREDTADAVLEKMTNGRFRHMPVLENGKMIGLISIGDVVKARLSELAMEKGALQDIVMGH